MTGVSLGGDVTTSSALGAVYDGMRLATLLCCIGAANTLANPKRALRAMPSALYELGVALTVAVTIAPQLVESGQRVLRARKLRGATDKGRRAVRGVAMPVIHDALERSFALAGAMDSRGYGRRAELPARARNATAALLRGALLGMCVGVYALLDTSTPRALGWPMLIVGATSAVVGLRLGGRRVPRTRYRPDPWLAPEWCTAVCGVIAAAMMILASRYNAAPLNPSVSPAVWPSLPLLPVLGLAIATIPAFATPPPAHHAISTIDLTSPERRVPAKAVA
jgi:energy-coupling factor transport system permease protein